VTGHADARPFLDTNVLLYLLSGDAGKADRAEALLAGRAIVSVQVLNEFVNVASRKLGLTWNEVGEVLAAVRATCRVEPSPPSARPCAGVGRALPLAFYDGVIVASALLAGCKVLYSEDASRPQVDRALSVNPFRV
jgi:predicted nucleic acid-binding protein